MNRGSNPFQKFVSAHAKLFQAGKKLSPPDFKKSPRGKISKDSPCALIFSPHPDDECIVGGLALRLRREANWKVINVAVTLGSKRERRLARLRELKNACDFLDFDLIVADLEKINLETRRKNRAQWKFAAKITAQILAKLKPRAIFVPHENDFHAAHIGTHFLIFDALKTLPKNFNCWVVETEFWGQMTNPNLLAEVGAREAADLIAALSLHAGEVKRNPYHARLPAWMADNVRRGAELVAGQGKSAPNFPFGTIYRLQKWSNGKFQTILKSEKILSTGEKAAKLFK